MKHGLAIALAACLTVVGGISLGYSFTMNTDADTVGSKVQETSEQTLSDITTDNYTDAADVVEATDMTETADGEDVNNESADVTETQDATGAVDAETGDAEAQSSQVIDLTPDYRDSMTLSAGVDTTIETFVDPDSIPRDVIEGMTFWGYHNLGIAQVENHLNVRSIPSTDGKLVGKMSNNAACEVRYVKDGWAYITSGLVDGYVSMDYLLTGREAVMHGATVATPLALVTADALNVREEPNLDCEVVSSIPHGQMLEYKYITEDGWVCIDLDGEDVFLNAEYVDIQERLDTAITMSELLYGAGVSDVRVSLVAEAQKYIGNPYVYGGTSLTKGTDCSGFTMRIFQKFGISLPRTAAEQARTGTKVSLSDVRPGDLIFYGSSKRISHVVIYIGNGQVVHASSKRTGIKISDMYYRTPVCARSYINN